MEAALRSSVWGRSVFKFLALLAHAPEKYENQLALDRPVSSARRAQPGVWFALLLICLLPRLWMTWKIDTVCPDAVLYLRLADALHDGNWSAGLEQISLNTFTLILMQLQRLGADLTVAGQWWSLAVSTLAVLPIYGFARRQFDERVGLLAAFFYAIHPAAIERSPEVVRDPTYWLFFMLSLYLSWRAIAELRWHLFAAAGMSVALAALTRFEGLFLMIPLAGWSLVRAWHFPAARWRLAAGGLIVVLSFPLAVYGIRVVWLQDAPVERMVRTDPLDRVKFWISSWLPGDEAAAGSTDVAAAPAPTIAAKPVTDAPETPAPVVSIAEPVPVAAPPEPASTAIAVPTANAAPPMAAVPSLPDASLVTAEVAPRSFGNRMSMSESLHIFSRKGIEGLNPFALLAAAVSVIAWWPLARRSDQLPLLALVGTILLSSWIHMSFSGELSSRYFISVFLVMTPWSGLGMMWPPSRRLHGLQNWAHDDWRPGVVAALMLAALAIGCWSNAFMTSFEGRRQLADAARWTCQHYGADAEVWAARDNAALFGFYAHTQCRVLEGTEAGALLDAVASSHADVIVIPTGKKHLAAALTASQARLGLKRVIVRGSDPDRPELVLLVRPSAAEATRMSRSPTPTADSTR
jgi:4-amino-4-deoxy-L-arabinose transferase-like glycosyltransferase